MKDSVRVEYPAVNPMKLEPHFSRHMLAMTVEDLNGKAEIAEQLAWRDKRIAELEAQLKTADVALVRKLLGE